MRIHGICEYNGANYAGWQRQPDLNTIQGEIEKIVSRILDTEITIHASGRTDAGVHALNQHFHFTVEKEVNDLSRFTYAVNCLLPDDIVIKKFEIVDDKWHARFSAVGKKYIYKIVKARKDAFLTKLAWLNPYDLDLGKLKEALNLFVGKRNFINFTSKEEDEDGFIREIQEINVSGTIENLQIEFIGNGFMRYEIRYIVGCAAAYALNQIDLDYIQKHLKDVENREIVCYKAPSDGLYLAEVFYK